MLTLGLLIDEGGFDKATKGMLTGIHKASGVLMSLYGGYAIDVFGMFTIPAQDKVKWLSSAARATHGIASKILIGVIVLHVLGALKRHYHDRDNTLRRMLFGQSG